MKAFFDLTCAEHGRLWGPPVGGSRSQRNAFRGVQIRTITLLLGMSQFSDK